MASFIRRMAPEISLMAASRGIGFSGCRALILDPSLNNRRLLHDILVDLHCDRVVSFSQLDDAWAELGKGGINAVFLDWSPAIDAPGVLRMLRGPASPERYVPVVVVASYGGPEDVMRARDSGATEFMLRPFSKDVVAGRLRAIVKAPRPFVASDNYFGPDRRRHHLAWEGTERRSRDRRADRRGGDDARYAGPERRLERSANPPPPQPLPTRGRMPMSQKEGMDWRNT